MKLIDAELLKHEMIMESAKPILAQRLLLNIIDDAPTIDAEPVRRGRWVIEPGIGCECSACGFDIGNDLDFMEYVKYCPNCGAKMEEQHD